MVRRSSEAYDRFSQAVDGPMLVLAVLWLPVLIWPLVAHPSPAVASSLKAIDYTVWALFVVEYLVKLYLAPNRWQFVRTHVLDLVIVAVPIFRPLRALRLVRVAYLSRVAIVGGEVVRRAKGILTHRGLHFVLLAVVILVFIAAAIEKVIESGAKGSNIHSYADPSGGRW
jgi:voltage-gated potassium channel